MQNGNLDEAEGHEQRANWPNCEARSEDFDQSLQSPAFVHNVLKLFV